MSPEVKCEHCGTINLAGHLKCRMCGWPLLEVQPGFRACPECGSVHTPLEERKCITCGWNFVPPKRPLAQVKGDEEQESCEHWSELPAHTARMARIDMAGILILVAGALGITHALLSALPGTSSDLMYHYEKIVPAGKFLNGLIQDNDILAAFMFISGALAMGLSMTIFKRGNLPLAVIGGVFGFVAIGFLLGAFFSLVGLLILAVSKREFLLECS